MKQQRFLNIFFTDPRQYYAFNLQWRVKSLKFTAEYVMPNGATYGIGLSFEDYERVIPVGSEENLTCFVYEKHRWSYYEPEQSLTPWKQVDLWTAWFQNMLLFGFAKTQYASSSQEMDWCAGSVVGINNSNGQLKVDLKSLGSYDVAFNSRYYPIEYAGTWPPSGGGGGGGDGGEDGGDGGDGGDEGFVPEDVPITPIEDPQDIDTGTPPWTDNASPFPVSSSFTATLEATEFWEYDPEDGGGPVYDSKTGECLRPDKTFLFNNINMD